MPLAVSANRARYRKNPWVYLKIRSVLSSVRSKLTSMTIRCPKSWSTVQTKFLLNGTSTIDVSTLANGVYIAEIKDRDRISVKKKIVKE